MDIFEKEIDLICAIYEDSDIKIVDAYFLENFNDPKSLDTIERAAGSIEKLYTSIERIIEKFKKFIQDIKMRFSIDNAVRNLRKESSKQIHEFEVRFKDEELSHYIEKFTRLNNDALLKYSKIRDQYLKGKIDISAARYQINNVQKSVEKDLEDLVKGTISLRTDRRRIKGVVEAEKVLRKIGVKQNEFIDKINKDISDELKKNGNELKSKFKTVKHSNKNSYDIDLIIAQAGTFQGRAIINKFSKLYDIGKIIIPIAIASVGVYGKAASSKSKDNKKGNRGKRHYKSSGNNRRDGSADDNVERLDYDDILDVNGNSIL